MGFFLFFFWIPRRRGEDRGDWLPLFFPFFPESKIILLLVLFR